MDLKFIKEKSLNLITLITANNTKITRGFNNDFYIKGITNIDELLLLINSKDYSNINYGKTLELCDRFGVVIFNSSQDIMQEKYILLYKNTIMKNNYYNMNDLIICVEALEQKYNSFQVTSAWDIDENYDFKIDDITYLYTSEALLRISSDKVKKILSEKIKLKDILLNIIKENNSLFIKSRLLEGIKDIENYTFSNIYHLRHYVNAKITLLLFQQYIKLLNLSEFKFTKIINKELDKIKCINLPNYSNDIVIKYSHNMRKNDRITNNIISLVSIIPSTKLIYYNYVLTDSGLHIGEVIDILENGVIHPLLVINPDDPVIIAGEIKCNNNNLTFNFLSGIYSSSQTDPYTIANLIIVMTNIFALNLTDKKYFTNITFSKKELGSLLPTNLYTSIELKSFCDLYPNNIIKVNKDYRCINNVYTNLPPEIRTKIEDSMKQSSDALTVYNEISTIILKKQYTTGIEEKPTLSVIDEINNALRIFGLNDFKLGTFDDMFKSFTTMITKLDTGDYGTFTSIGVNKLKYTRTKMDGSVEMITYTYIRNISSGSFNETALYYIDSDVANTVIIRKNINKLFNLKLQYVSFYENLKHLILYILIRKYIIYTKYNKFIPKPFHLGFLKLPNNNITTIMVMEGGVMDLSKYIGSDTIKIKTMICKIYNMLYVIEDILKINFKHNDCKGNNIVVTKDNMPMLIDFGLSEFTLHGAINLKFMAYTYEGGIIELIKNTMYINSQYNIIHDILQLMLFLFIQGNDTYTIFTFTSNKNKYLMDGPMLKQYIKSKLFPTVKTSDLWRYFYNKYAPPYGYIDKKINLEQDVKDGIITTDSLNITPEIFAQSMGVNIGDLKVAEYTKKYLKYKYKYLQLHKKYNMSLPKLSS